MDAYIDLANFCSYLKSQSNQLFRDCNKALKQGFNLKFTFDQSEMDRVDKKTRRCYEIWESDISSGRNGHKITWNEKRPTAEQIFADSWDATDNMSHANLLMSLYMIDVNEEERAKYGNLLVAKPGEELSAMLALRINGAFKDIYPMDTDELNDWSIFSAEVHNCTDIIISDQHLFWVSDDVYKENVCEILKETLVGATGTKVNVVFFAFGTDRDNPVLYNTVIRNIKACLTDCGFPDANVTYVLLPRHEEHDRSMVTNYKTFTPHFSFNLFENGTKRTAGRYFEVRSHADTKVFKMATQLISDLQAVVDLRKNQPGGIEGDQKSNLLNF